MAAIILLSSEILSVAYASMTKVLQSVSTGGSYLETVHATSMAALFPRVGQRLY